MRALLFVALASLCLGGCIQPTAPPPVESVQPPVSPVPLDADGFSAILVEGFRHSTFTVTSREGKPVFAEAYVPDADRAVAGMEVPDRFPTILLASPYNGDGYGPNPRFGYDPYDFLVQRLLPRGYALVIGDSSAMGGSGGCWDFMGPQDAASAVALVEGITQQPWSDGKVGMMGLSYDAMTQIMAASHNAPGLVTVVPAAALTHAYAGLYMNGVHYGGGWMTTTAGYTQGGLMPPGMNEDRYPGWLDSVASAPVCATEANTFGKDPTGRYNEYYQARDFRPLASNVNASVFYIQGFLDPAVKPDNLGDWFESVPGPKKAWLGHWYHQYPTAMNAGRDDLYLTLHRWFDHWLKGVPNGIDTELHMDVQDSQGGWRHEATWPPLDVQAHTLYIDTNESLAATPGPQGTLEFGGPGSAVKAMGMTMGTLAIDSGPLDKAMHIAGRPSVNLTLASDRLGGQVIVNLWEVDGDQVRPVSRGAFNLLLDASLQSAAPLEPGTFKTVSFTLYPTDHVIPAGRMLRVTLETTGNAWFNPDPWTATLTLATGPGTPATITLPTVERTGAFLESCGRALDNWGLECHDPELEDEGKDW